MKNFTNSYAIIAVAILSLLVVTGCTTNDENMLDPNDTVDTTTDMDTDESNDDMDDIDMDDEVSLTGRFYVSSNTMNTVGVFDE